MILPRSGSLDTGYKDLDDATSKEGREVRVDATMITLISLRLVQQETHREALTKFYENANTYSVSEQKDKIDMGFLNSLGQNYNK